MKSITINNNDAGQRLDKFLQKYLSLLPQSLIYKYIRKKRIKVNGKKCQIDYMLVENDLLEMYINDELFEEPNTENAFLKIKNPEVKIVYEDENILLVDKKPGICVHPDEGEKINTLISHVQSYLFKKGEYNPDVENTFAPALCNRIDRNTGGIVVVAKNSKSLRILNEKIKNKEITKLYLCIVHGIMDDKPVGTLKGYLVKNSELNKVFVFEKPQKSSKTAITKYKVLEEKGGLSLVEAELITGRTHQIRAQFANIGHPLLGDGKYGTNAINMGYKIKYQALYSYKIIFNFSDENFLSYLNKKQFTAYDIDFLKDWKENSL